MAVVWHTGAFFDSDDAMRLVQVRDWLSGQGWFDLMAHRMGPPPGVFMHWSRVVDVPLAALIRLFELFATPERSEILARLAFSSTLQIAMVTATAWVAKILAGPSIVLPAVLLLVLDGLAYGPFQPGRIVHHAPEILLLMAMTGTTLASFDPAQARKAAITGVLVALSMALSLENMPFIPVLLASPTIAWVIVGDPLRRTLRWLAIGLGIAAPVMFAATVAPQRYGVISSDDFSLGYVVLLLLGAAGLLLLASDRVRLRHWSTRAAACTVLGGLLLAVARVGFPRILESPFFGLDPLVKHLWLDGVDEGRPILATAFENPVIFAILIAPYVIGAAATTVAAFTHRGISRGRWCALLGLVLAGGVGALFAQRVAFSVGPLALLGAAWAVASVTRSAKTVLVRTIVTLAMLAAFSAVGWALVPLPTGLSKPEREGPFEGVWRQPQELQPLAQLSPGLAVAPIDIGAHLLAYTRLSVLAAPYHRNSIGDRAALDVLLSPPDQAETIVRQWHARYVIVCPGNGSIVGVVQAAPDGLAAQLISGRVPRWLRPVPLAGTIYHVFEVVDAVG